MPSPSRSVSRSRGAGHRRRAPPRRARFVRLEPSRAPSSPNRPSDSVPMPPATKAAGSPMASADASAEKRSEATASSHCWWKASKIAAAALSASMRQSQSRSAAAAVCNRASPPSRIARRATSNRVQRPQRQRVVLHRGQCPRGCGPRGTRSFPGCAGRGSRSARYWPTDRDSPDGAGRLLAVATQPRSGLRTLGMPSNGVMPVPGVGGDPSRGDSRAPP